MELICGEGGRLGFSVTQRNVIDKVHGGGSADKAGLQEGDVVIAVNGVRLARGTRMISLLPKGRQGLVVSLSITRLMPTAAETEAPAAGDAPSGRKRAQPDRLGGMTSLDGVRIGNGAQTHAQRLTCVFAAQTGESL